MKIKIFNNNSLIDSQFEINEKIGTGGFGEIYKVTGNYDTEAVIKFGDFAAAGLNFPLHKVVQLLHLRHGVIAPGNTALVGNHENFVASLGQISHGLPCSLHPAQIADFIQIIHVHIEDAVTIEKNGLIFHRHNNRRSCLRAGNIPQQPLRWE